MNKDRILIVEDQPSMIKNYYRWFGDDYELDAVRNAEDAIEMLTSKYYSVVLLDWVLDKYNPNDESSIEVQKFLKKYGQGTKLIVVSGRANKRDVRTATIGYSAFDVIFKEELHVKDALHDTNILIEKVNEGIALSKKDMPNFVLQASSVFSGDDENYLKFEYDIKQVLRPEKGFSGWFDFQKDFFKDIAPIYNHRDVKKNVTFFNDYVLGLFWSRKIGHAVSICLANIEIQEDQCVNALTSWLGWGHTNGVEFCSQNIRGFYFIEDSLRIDDFNMNMNHEGL